MGTRGITRVIRNAETKISQYGQWDHYPDGQGITILDFLRNVNVEKFMEQLDKCRFTTDDDVEEFNNFCDSIDAKGGWANLQQSELINKKYPLLSRDLGGGILMEVYLSELDSIVLAECTAESWIEGIYTINFDDDTFRVEYHDFDETFILSSLPTNEEFINVFKDEDDEDE